MFNNFNPHGNMMMGSNQYTSFSNNELLEELKHVAAYSGISHSGMMVLGELYQRASRSFGKTFVPSEEVHGNLHLYTSAFKNGLMYHFFTTDEDKQKIDEVFKQTTHDPKEGPSHFGMERINALVELGDIFKAIPVDEYGRQTGPIQQVGFAVMVAGQGFSKDTQHPSKVLPLGVIEIPTLAIFNTSPSSFASIVMSAAVMLIRDHEKLVTLESCLSKVTVLKEYETALKDIIKQRGTGIGHELITQIHLFPVNESSPIKILGGLEKNWKEGFVDRKQHPSLFGDFGSHTAYQGPHNYGPTGGFNGFGPANGGPWA